jgi:3'-phosphoadenosine 5'-phosphosulfate (PAPS) 3'-phosphatase
MHGGLFNMQAASFAQYLPRILMTAKRAGEEILRVYHGAVSVTLKDDRSPLTEADQASHQVIAKELATIAFSAAPDMPSAYLRQKYPLFREAGLGVFLAG